MPNNIFSKNSIIWVFQRNFMFFLKIAMYQKIAKFSTLWTGVKLNHKWKFSSIFLFLLPFRNSIMPNNIFSKNSIIWVFQRNFMFFFEDCNVPKNCEILHFVNQSEPQSQMEVFFDFFSFYYHLEQYQWQITYLSKNSIKFFNQCNVQIGKSPLCEREWSSITNGIFLRIFLFLLPFRNSIMPNNMFSKNSIIWVFQRNFMFFFWRLQCTKKLRNSPLCEPEWTSITNGSFLRFFLFLLPFRNSIMPNNIFSKNSIIWVFQRNFMFFLKIAMYQKIAKFSTLWTGVKLNHKWKFSSIFLFLLPFRNSIMPNNIFSKNSIIWVFQRNFMFFFEDCNVPKNCEILHFVNRSEPQSQMEVFFDFFSFYYHLGTVSCQITFFQKTQ